MRVRRPSVAMPALLALVVLGLAASYPVSSAFALFTKQASVTANTLGHGSRLADNPVSYRRLHETSGTVAADGKGSNPGTYTGGPALAQTGRPARHHQQPGPELRRSG